MAKPRILFINPRDSPANELFSSADGITAPLGLAYLAAYLRDKGFNDLKILDANVLKLNNEEIKREIVSYKPDIVGIGCLTPTVFNALSIAKMVKEVDTKTHVIFGGAHSSAVPDEILEDKNVDFVIRGEGEETMLDLSNSIANKKPLSSIKGISYKNKGKVVHNKDRELIKNLDSLPFPAWDLLSMDKYYLPATRKNVVGKSGTILTSRGCPFNCIFCSKAVFGRTIRYRSPESIIQELEILKNKYDIKEVLFVDDTITLNKERMVKLCKLMIEKKLNLKWECHSRVDAISEELLENMRTAGCKSIAFGIESGSQEMLEKIGKKITLEQAINTIKLCRKYKIKTLCSFMFGNPGETKKTAEETIKFAKKLNPDFANFFNLVPLPGSRVFGIAKEKGLINSKEYINYIALSNESPVIELSELKKEELVHLQKSAMKEFYFRPSYILKRLFEIRSTEEIKQSVRGFLTLLKFQTHKYN